MPLDLSAVGFKSAPYTFTYDWKTVVLYALGIGARKAELDYLYEGRGPAVFPTFAVVPAYPALTDLVARTGGDMEMVVHGSQSVQLFAPIPPSGTLKTVGTIDGIYDMKRLAQVVFSTETTLDGTPICGTQWSILIRNAGGFGGPRPPKLDIPSVPDGATPAFEYVDPTSPEQALLYRLSGDLNPLHADPEFAQRVGFEGGPILHGLCTFGFVARAVVLNACGGNGARLKRFGAQFRKPVWPGETIKTTGYDLGDGRWALEAFAADRPEPVVTNCWAEVAGS